MSKESKKQEHPIFRCTACMRGTAHEPKIVTDPRAIFATEALMIELTCMTCQTVNHLYTYDFEMLRSVGFIINFQQIEQ